MQTLQEARHRRAGCERWIWRNNIHLYGRLRFRHDAGDHPGHGDIPGNKLLDEWSCPPRPRRRAARTRPRGVCEPGGRCAGCHDVVTAQDRACSAGGAPALDRVLLNGWYTIPGWHSPGFTGGDVGPVLAWPDKPVREGFVVREAGGSIRRRVPRPWRRGRGGGRAGARPLDPAGARGPRPAFLSNGFQRLRLRSAGAEPLVGPGQSPGVEA